MKNWKRRYFVLDENSLNYYKTDMVRKRWRAQTRWHQCSKTHHVAPKQTLKKKRVKKICACCKTCCVSPHAEACVLNTSSCHLRVDRLALTTACLCTYMGTPRVCVCAYIYVCLAECSHLFMCNHVLSECSCCRGHLFACYRRWLRVIQTDTIKHLDHAYHQHTRVFMDADPNDTRANYLTVK